MAELTPESGRYPQINLNTGVSLAAVVLLIGMVVWSVDLKSSVSDHERRLVSTEVGIKELRTLVDSVRFGLAASETKLEVRLAKIDLLLQDISNRLPERDRRGGP